jgi:precorrin-8X/cobalt-precorrin-8 methylmutase
MAASAIKTMAKNTNGNSVVSAKQWFNDKDLLGLTKTAYGIEKGWIELSAKNSGIQSPIIVIGSSPTALINLLEIIKNSQHIPSLIIGMPVGFIGVSQSKKKLLNTNYPRIVVNSTRGGAAMAAAAVNALLRETI